MPLGGDAGVVDPLGAEVVASTVPTRRPVQLRQAFENLPKLLLGTILGNFGLPVRGHVAESQNDLLLRAAVHFAADPCGVVADDPALVDVDPVNQRSAAAEKLMARHYDAVVVDCDDEENSAPLLKSAHTSSLNQSSLAIALVEGQAGVAKAYRIGANLVLTKPINVEQAKGTLRVARGLLRKNADAATASTQAPSATPAKAAPAGVAGAGAG